MLLLLSACNTINIKPNEIHNSEFFLDARFSITITENNSNNSNLQNNYQGNLIFVKNNNDSFDVKILSPLNTMLAEIKSNKNNACLYKNSDNQNNLIPEYCDQNIDLLVNYFLQNNSNKNNQNNQNNQNNFITISEIPNWLKQKFPENSQIIFDNYNRIKRADLFLTNDENYILIYTYKNENDTIPFRLTIQQNNNIYLKLIINNWQEN